MDDIAACSLAKYYVDKGIDVVHNNGQIWRYSFNAKKSPILIFSERKCKKAQNMVYRGFWFGPDEGLERRIYDHMGIQVSVDVYDVTGLKERLSKIRRALNPV